MARVGFWKISNGHSVIHLIYNNIFKKKTLILSFLPLAILNLVIVKVFSGLNNFHGKYGCWYLSRNAGHLITISEFWCKFDTAPIESGANLYKNLYFWINLQNVYSQCLLVLTPFLLFRKLYFNIYREWYSLQSKETFNCILTEFGSPSHLPYIIKSK